MTFQGTHGVQGHKLSKHQVIFFFKRSRHLWSTCDVCCIAHESSKQFGTSIPCQGFPWKSRQQSGGGGGGGCCGLTVSWSMCEKLSPQCRCLERWPTVRSVLLRGLLLLAPRTRSQEQVSYEVWVWRLPSPFSFCDITTQWGEMGFRIHFQWQVEELVCRKVGFRKPTGRWENVAWAEECWEDTLRPSVDPIINCK